MKKYIVFSVCILFSSAFVLANEKITNEKYIDTWKSVAVQNMLSHKIPASITLAQGILESGSGNSVLAKRANNHFGIKCHDWIGEKFFLDDDAPNECFRKYGVANESFKDHSVFLTSRSRYSKLFELEITDYKSWAKGLKEAGYATNPKYPELLVNLIEKLKLYEYDSEGVVNQKTNIKDVFAKNNKTNNPSKEFTSSKQVIHQVKMHENKILYVIAKKGDSFYKIAKEFDLGLWQLYKYNDFSEKKEYLEEGDIVFIQPKRNKSRVDKSMKLDKQYTLRELSQLKGVKLERLIQLNEIKNPDEVLKSGEKVLLK